jgi:hypothetical protein
MVTSGVVVLLGLMVLAVVLVVLFKRLGTSTGFLAGSWLPLASLLLAFAFRGQLGRSILAVVIVVAIISLFMVGIGITLTTRARREGSGSLARLATATVLAGAPLLHRRNLTTACRRRRAGCNMRDKRMDRET